MTTHTNVHCPHCNHAIRVKTRQYTIADTGLTIPTGHSLHCPTCLQPIPPGATLPYWSAPTNPTKGGDAIEKTKKPAP